MLLPAAYLLAPGLLGSKPPLRGLGVAPAKAPTPTPTPAAPLLPRVLLLGAAVGYGSNFPVGRLINEVAPASATTSGRFLLAALVLSPFLPKLDKSLVRAALISGLADSVGYCAQSIALVDTPAAKVAFLGALTVVWVPALGALFDGRDLRPRSAPQVAYYVRLRHTNR